MLFHRQRWLHCLWLSSPKQCEIINGIEIPYLKVSRFLIKGNEGMVLYTQESGEVMVFVAGNDPFRRYTIYHEFREGEIFRQHKSENEILDAVLKKIQIIANILGQPCINISSKEILESLTKWVKTQKGHSEAILDELKLAHKELSLDNFRLFWEDCKRENRLKLKSRSIRLY
jgi:predicted Ser/Thr protein kinase